MDVKAVYRLKHEAFLKFRVIPTVIQTMTWFFACLFSFQREEERLFILSSQVFWKSCSFLEKRWIDAIVFIRYKQGNTRGLQAST